MTSDRLDRIDLLVARIKSTQWTSTEWLVVECLDLIAEHLRYLHNRPPAQQLFDSGQELLKEQN